METIKPLVMVIEDEVLLLEAITKKLTISDIEVVSCSSAKQALEFLEKNNRKPDIIWLDYYLKDMDGLDFMQNLKANPKSANIPVVVVSNSASPEKVDGMNKLGVKKFLLKAEYRMDEIIGIIMHVMNENRQVIKNVI